MRWSSATRYVRVSLGDWNLAEKLYPYACQQRLDGELPPVEVRVIAGRELADFVWSPLSILLVSDRAIELFKSSNIVGWDEYSVVVMTKSGGLITGYRGLSIRGRGGMMDLSRSEEIFVPSSRGGSWVVPMLKGIRFENDYWDGSDIFVGAGRVVISERLYKLIKKNKISGGSYEPLSSCITSLKRGEIMLPRQDGQA